MQGSACTLSLSLLACMCACVSMHVCKPCTWSLPFLGVFVCMQCLYVEYICCLYHCLCMYICMHACMCVCMGTHDQYPTTVFCFMCVHSVLYMYIVCTDVRGSCHDTYIDTHIQTYIHQYTHTHTHTHSILITCKPTCVQPHTYPHAILHTTIIPSITHEAQPTRDGTA